MAFLTRVNGTLCTGTKTKSSVVHCVNYGWFYNTVMPRSGGAGAGGRRNGCTDLGQMPLTHISPVVLGYYELPESPSKVR